MSVLARFRGLPRRLNPALTPLARVLPPLAVLHHRGRRSGHAYDTPVQAYRTPTGFIVGLAYSDNPNWVRNILASGGGTITRGRHRYTISNPRRRGPDARNDLPTPIAAMMRALGITNYLEFDTAPSDRP